MQGRASCRCPCSPFRTVWSSGQLSSRCLRLAPRALGPQADHLDTLPFLYHCFLTSSLTSVFQPLSLSLSLSRSHSLSPLTLLAHYMSHPSLSKGSKPSDSKNGFDGCNRQLVIFSPFFFFFFLESQHRDSWLCAVAKSQ